MKSCLKAQDITMEFLSAFADFFDEEDSALTNNEEEKKKSKKKTVGFVAQTTTIAFRREEKPKRLNPFRRGSGVKPLQQENGKGNTKEWVKRKRAEAFTRRTGFYF